MEGITYRIENGDIIETTVTEKTYNTLEYIASIESKINSKQIDLANYTESVTKDLTELQNKLNAIQALLNINN